MEEIKYDFKMLPKIKVEIVDYSEEDDLKTLPLKEGLCVRNSYKVAEVKKGKMVEGFLVTKYKSKPLNCVAHVWNNINGEHFDYTALIKNHNEEIVSHTYFPVLEYDFEEKSIEMLKSNGKPLSNFDIRVKLHEHIIFKSKVKQNELALLQELRKQEAESNKDS